MNVGPSHRIIEYDAANATPLNAREAMRGSPSPRKVFAIMPKDASVRDNRLRISVKERLEGVDVALGEFRIAIAQAVAVIETVSVQSVEVKTLVESWELGVGSDEA